MLTRPYSRLNELSGEVRRAVRRTSPLLAPEKGGLFQVIVERGTSAPVCNYWVGMPNPTVIFHSDDWTAIPFSLIWTGFFVFWEAQALGFWGKNSRPGGTDVFMALWGIPFLVLGNYIVWGRFLVDAWLKRRTYYAVTNRRVLVLQEGWKKKTSMTFLEAIPAIEQEGTGTGTLWFGPKYPVLAAKGRKTRNMSRFSIGDVPVFADIGDVDSVCRLVMDLREREGGGSISGPLTYAAPSHP